MSTQNPRTAIIDAKISTIKEALTQLSAVAGMLADCHALDEDAIRTVRQRANRRCVTLGVKRHAILRAASKD